MKKDAINLLEKGSWEVARDEEKVVLHTGWLPVGEGQREATQTQA